MKSTFYSDTLKTFSYIQNIFECLRNYLSADPESLTIQLFNYLLI